MEKYRYFYLSSPIPIHLPSICLFITNSLTIKVKDLTVSKIRKKKISTLLSSKEGHTEHSPLDKFLLCRAGYHLVSNLISFPPPCTALFACRFHGDTEVGSVLVVGIEGKIGRFRVESVESDRNRTRPNRFPTELCGVRFFREKPDQTVLNQSSCPILHWFQTELLDLDRFFCFQSIFFLFFRRRWNVARAEIARFRFFLSHFMKYINSMYKGKICSNVFTEILIDF